MRIEFWVPGLPATAGSKTSFPHKVTGKMVTIDSSGAHGKTWRSDVKHFAFDVYQGPALKGSMWLFVRFVRTRPLAHFGTGKNAGVLKANAPLEPTTRPDATKLLRAVEDALKGVLWVDDAQVQPGPLGLDMKVYGENPGARVVICTTRVEAFCEQFGYLRRSILDSKAAGLGLANPMMDLVKATPDAKLVVDAGKPVCELFEQEGK